MGRKCCVPGCRTGYDAGDRTPVYRLPKDQVERSRWIQAIPRDNIPNGPNTVVCENHWPTVYMRVLKNGKYRPVVPPSVFNCVPKRKVQTQSTSTPITIAVLSQCVTDIDQSEEFYEVDKIPVSADCVDIKYLVEIFKQHLFHVPIISYVSGESAVIQSVTLMGGIPLFIVKISKTLSFESFRCGVQCDIPSLACNKITIMDRWSAVEEAVKYLSTAKSNQ